MSALLAVAPVWALAAGSSLDLPPLNGPVLDQAGVLSAGTVQKLDALLRQVNDRGVLQLQVLTLKSLNGLPIEQASIQITDLWKLGTKEKDNGVLFLIVPSERKMRIEVGQGLEGDIPDITAKRIIADVVTPYFKQSLFDEGVTAGAIEIIRHADPDAIGSAPVRRERSSERGLPLWVFLLFLLIIFMKFLFGGRPGGPRGWGPGGFGGGGFGGGGFGGGSGGGWSGGGGGFSGGGASGNW